MNGHHGPVPGPDHTSILVDMSGRLGRIEGGMVHMFRAVTRIEGRMDQPPTPTPRRDWLTLAIGMVILASAAAGKVAWSDALPSLLGLVGR